MSGIVALLEQLRRVAKRILLAVLVVFTAASAFARPAKAQESSCTRRTVLVGVATQDGYPVQDLSTANFEAKYRGKPVRILSQSWDARPRRIVIVLDASGSMMVNGERNWRLALRAVQDMMNAAPAEAQFALVLFGGGPTQTIKFEKGRAAIAQHLATLEKGSAAFPKGARLTALLDSILRGLEMLGAPQPGDAIYAITDGGDNLSRHRPGDVERELVQAQVRLFVSVLAEPLASRSRSPEELGGPDEMRELASATGGAMLLFTVPDTSNDASLRVASLRLYRQMADVHRLKIELPEPVDKPRDWKLQLKPDKNSKLRNLVISYPHKLLPCAPPKGAQP